MFCLNHSDFVTASVHQPTQYKRTVSDENNTIKHRIKESTAVKQKNSPWIGMRDWTYQQFTIHSLLRIRNFSVTYINVSLFTELMKTEWLGEIFLVFVLRFGIFYTKCLKKHVNSMGRVLSPRYPVWQLLIGHKVDVPHWLEKCEISHWLRCDAWYVRSHD